MAVRSAAPAAALLLLMLLLMLLMAVVCRCMVGTCTSLDSLSLSSCLAVANWLDCWPKRSSSPLTPWLPVSA